MNNNRDIYDLVEKLCTELGGRNHSKFCIVSPEKKPNKFPLHNLNFEMLINSIESEWEWSK